MRAEILERIARDADPKSGVCRDVDDTTLYWETTNLRENFGFIRAIGAVPVVIQARKGTVDPASVLTVLRSIDPSCVERPQSPRRVWCPLASFGFDEVMLIPPSLFKTMLDKPTTWMKDVAWKALPAYGCEHPVEETVGEADTHMRLLSPDWKRRPEPFLRMRFLREKRSIHSTGGKRRALFPWAEVERVFGLLAVDDGFIEIDNFEGEEARIEHHGSYIVTFRGLVRTLPASQAKTWLETFAIHGADRATEVLSALEQSN